MAPRSKNHTMGMLCFGANKWLRQWLLALTAWNKPKSLSVSKSTTMKSLLTMCHLLAFSRIFWMLSMWASDAQPYQVGDAYRMRDNIIAWNTFNNCFAVNLAFWSGLTNIAFGCRCALCILYAFPLPYHFVIRLRSLSTTIAMLPFDGE